MLHQLKNKKFEIFIGVLFVVFVAIAVLNSISSEKEHKDCVRRCKKEYREEIEIDSKARKIILDRCLDNCNTEREQRIKLNDHNRNREW